MSRDDREISSRSTGRGGLEESTDLIRVPILKKPIDTLSPFRRVVLFVLRRSPITQGVLTGFLFLAVSSACALTCYATAMNAFRFSFDEHLLTLARISAQQIDPEAHARLVDPEQLNGPEYLAVVQQLRQIVEASPDLLYIYTLRPSPEGLRFIVDTGLPSDTDADGIIDQAPLGMIHRDPPAPIVQAPRSSKTLVSGGPHADDWGAFHSAWSPVRHDDGRLECLVGVDVDVKDFGTRHAAIRQSLMLAFAVAIIASRGDRDGRTTRLASGTRLRLRPGLLLRSSHAGRRNQPQGSASPRRSQPLPEHSGRNPILSRPPPFF